MKFENYVAKMQRIEKQMSRTFPNPHLTGSFINPPMLAQPKMLSILDSIARVQSIPYNQLYDAPLQRIQLQMENALAAQERIVALASAQNTMLYRLSLPLSSDIFTTLYSAIDCAMPYMQAEQRAECEQIVSPVKETGNQRKLTLSELLSILSILITVYFGIVSSVPNKQLDRIIQQNETIIEQQQKLIELNFNDSELRETLQTLQTLSDGIQLLSDEIERSNDISELNSQPDPQNSQDQN